MLVEPGPATPTPAQATDVLPGARVARRNYHLLDGVRAVAALMVVGYHVGIAVAMGNELWDGSRHLDMGVTVFFVLSGFLLYRPFLVARLKGNARPNVRRYLTRRVLRVVPAYWVAITVLGLTLPMLVPVLVPDWWIFYSLTQTWVPFRMFDGLSPAWSLSVEASFYLALPVYALVMRRLLGHRPVRTQIRVEFWVLVAISIASLLLRRFAFDRGEGPLGFLVWSFLGHMDWFAAGLALALASVLWDGATRLPRLLRSIERWPTTCWAAAALIIVLLGFLRGSPGDVVHVVSLVVAVLMVAPAIFGDESTGAVRQVLRSRLFAWLGLISYGIFLWNEPLAGWIAREHWNDWGVLSGGIPLLVLTVVASVVAGAASFYVIERPAMSLRFQRRRSRSDSTAPTE
jgi:peptidoglycan/LPS O-acetylase OafA/YrhL